MATAAEGSDALARVSRMRTLSALLDDELADDAALPEAALALLAPPAADAPADAEDAALAEQLAQSRAGAFECVECRAHAAELFCEQCHDYFCELCAGGQHRKGNRRAHTFQPCAAPPAAAADAQADDDDADGSAPPKDAVDYESDELEADEDEESDSDSGGSAYPSTMPRRLEAPPPAPSQKPLSSVEAAAAHATVLERAKFIPVRLTYEERKLLRALEAALSVSGYTDTLDTAAFAAPAKRVRRQLQDICGFLSGLAVASDYAGGQRVLDEKNFGEHADFFQELFELGRRYKIMNPEKMRGEYGKLMYLLQDACSPELQELLGFSCRRKIRTVYDVLADANALAVLSDPKIETATMVVAPEGKSRAQIQRQIKHKEAAQRALTDAYAGRGLTRDALHQCLYSIADNNYHLYFERDPIDRMVALLSEHFRPEDADDGYSLAIVSGSDGARLSHSHARQFHYVLQSLTLWREIAHDMFRLWCLTDDDLLADGTKYELTDTGQGLHRIQPAPRVARAMHVILHATQRRLDAWVGSSVIHLGDKNVPNALMFIDKYTQVGHILRPIVKTVDSIDALCANRNNGVGKYVDSTFGGAAKLKKDILADFFREAFDGSGADNFFEAGSCIDGRLTSAWNWCSSLHKKPFFPVFKLAGFVGFDGKFG